MRTTELYPAIDHLTDRITIIRILLTHVEHNLKLIDKQIEKTSQKLNELSSQNSYHYQRIGHRTHEVERVCFELESNLRTDYARSDRPLMVG